MSIARMIVLMVVGDVALALSFCCACADTSLPYVEGSWTLVVLPDTQAYTDGRMEYFSSQTDWISANADSRNVGFVLHEGDLTEHNTTEHWTSAFGAMTTLNNAGVPYALTVGNHDLGPDGDSSTRETLLNDYFTPSHFSALGTESIGTGSSPGVLVGGKLENSFHLFSAGGEDYVVVSLEFGPRDDVVAWADQVLDAYADRTAIVLTHCHQYYDGTRYDISGSYQAYSPYSFGIAGLPGGVNDGEELWQEVLKNHDNIQFVFSGHTLNPDPDYIHDPVGGFLTSIGVGGNDV